MRLVAHAVTPHTGGRSTWRAARADLDAHGSSWSRAVHADTGCQKTAWGNRVKLLARVDAAFEKTGDMRLKSATFLDRVIGPQNLQKFLAHIKKEGKDMKKRDVKPGGEESKKRDAEVQAPKKYKKLKKSKKEKKTKAAPNPVDVQDAADDDEDDDEEGKEDEKPAEDSD
jgi:hypothetical protein